MTKKGILEAISYKQHRVKFNGPWLNVDPFLNLEGLGVGKEYEAKLRATKDGWYIETFEEIKGE